MNSIQFESARDKEKIRQDIREAREQLLEEARKNAERRAARSEGNWMLPAISEKIEKNSIKKQKSKSAKKEKKSREKKFKKKRIDTESEDSDSAEETDKKEKSQKKKKKSKKSKNAESSSDNESQNSSRIRKKKKKKTKKHASSSSSSVSETSDWIAKPDKQEQEETKPEPMQRDSWMTSPFMLKTFSKERAATKPNAAHQSEAYDPTKNALELNPHWKSTGTGLPAFKKPRDDSDNEKHTERRVGTSNARGWEKKKAEQEPKSRKMSASSSSTTHSEEDADHKEDENQKVLKSAPDANNFLTDEQMNELAAKILKAELFGNTKLAEDLKEKLEQARSYRLEKKKMVQVNPKRNDEKSTRKRDESILLTHSDDRGNSRPLAQTRGLLARETDLWGGRRAKKSKRTETHEAGERVRYFADDDKYDIKQMVSLHKLLLL